MAKLSLVLASFALFLLVVNASIYRTTVEIDDENFIRGQSCQEQMQQQQNLRHCRLFMRQKAQQEESRGGQDNQEQQHFKECCQQVRSIEPGCRCRGLEQAARRQGQEMQGREMEEILYETASNIPQWCNIEPRGGCEFSSLNSQIRGD